MKAFLNLLMFLVIFLQTLSFIQLNINSEINKRQIISPDSLQNIVTTTNIGRIENNTEATIISSLRSCQIINELENSIRNFLVSQYNVNNLICENIYYNHAIFHLIQGQRINYSTFISSSIHFRINFSARNIDLESIIRNRNLGQIQVNNIIYILERIITLNLNERTTVELNSIRRDAIRFFNIENISQNSARVTSASSRFFGVVNVSFETDNLLLISMNLNTNLGQLPNNNPATIIQAFIFANPILQNQNLNIFNISSDSAVITRPYENINLRRQENRNIQRMLASNSNVLSNQITIFDNIRVNFNVPSIISSFFHNFIECIINGNLLVSKRSTEDVHASHHCSTVGIIVKEESGENNSFIVIDNNVYLEISDLGIALKFDSLNLAIMSIELDGKGSANVVTQNNEIYHLNINNLTIKKLVDMTSFDLKKEINLYYNKDKETTIIKNDLDRWNYVIVKDFNLKTINPLNYKKISFLKKDGDGFETTLKLNNIVFNDNKISLYDGQDLQKYISNCHVIKTEDGIGECGILKKIELQDIDEKISGNHILAGQNFYLTWYFENKEYHIQVMVEQEVNLNDVLYEGQVLTNIGQGIKLYNE